VIHKALTLDHINVAKNNALYIRLVHTKRLGDRLVDRLRWVDGEPLGVSVRPNRDTDILRGGHALEVGVQGTLHRNGAPSEVSEQELITVFLASTAGVIDTRIENLSHGETVSSS